MKCRNTVLHVGITGGKSEKRGGWGFHIISNLCAFWMESLLFYWVIQLWNNKYNFYRQYWKSFDLICIIGPKKIFFLFKFSISYILKTYIYIKGNLKDSYIYISSFLDPYSIPLNKVKWCFNSIMQN